MDQVFGRLMDTLERTGQANNTLVFITSDNGPNMETWPGERDERAQRSSWARCAALPATDCVFSNIVITAVSLLADC
jgi:arylsulfatase A-like enzyme